MTSADFSDYGFPCSETSPGKSFFLPPITAASTYLSTNYHFGRYKGVVAYPKQICLICRSCSSVPDFAVSLPSLLSSPTTSLRLANASGTTPCIRDLHPLEKYTCLEHCLTKIVCNFEILLLLAAGALCSCRAHTMHIKNRRNSSKFKPFGSYQTLCLTEKLELRNRLLFIY